MNLKHFRIKTKLEFEKEFGPEWRTEVSYRFPDVMDHLLGVPLNALPINYLINTSVLEKIKNGKDIIGIDVFSTNQWTISSDMIKYESIEKKIYKILEL